MKFYIQGDDVYTFSGWSKLAGVRFSTKCGLFLNVAGKRGKWFWQIHPAHSAFCYLCGRADTLFEAMRNCEDYAADMVQGNINTSELRAA